MKVVHIITSLSQGGAEAMLEKLILAGCAKREVENIVVSLRELGVIGPRLLDAGVRVEALHMGSIIGAVRGFARLVALLRSMPQDTIVQTWLYHGDLIGGLAAVLARRKHIIWNLRTTLSRRGLSTATYGVVRLCALLSARLPERIVSCGPTVKESHVAAGYAESKCVVIGNGFDTTAFRPMLAERLSARTQLGFAADDLVVGLIARMHPEKGYPNMVRAARHVIESHPNARFLWVGHGVENDPALTALISELELEHHVRRLGLRKDVIQLLNAMDVFCLPSRGEGFPNVLGEAMACALPCVTTASGDSAYLLGEPLWVVPVESPVDLANAVNRMLSLSAEQRQAIGRRNRARVTSEFTIDAASRNYVALYSSLTSNAPSGSD